MPGVGGGASCRSSWTARRAPRLKPLSPRGRRPSLRGHPVLKSRPMRSAARRGAPSVAQAREPPSAPDLPPPLRPPPTEVRSLHTVPPWDRHLLPSPGQRVTRPSPSPPARGIVQRRVFSVGHRLKRALFITTAACSPGRRPPSADRLSAPGLTSSFSGLSSTLKPGIYS